MKPMLNVTRNLAILRVEDQSDRLDYDYYRPEVLKWVRYSTAHRELNWTRLGGLLEFSTSSV